MKEAILEDISDVNKMDEDAASGDVDNSAASKVVLLSSNVKAVMLDTTTEVVLTFGSW